MKMKNNTGYPSIDKTHLKGTTFLERHPFIPSMTFSQVMDLMFFLQGNHDLVDCLNLKVSSKEFQKDSLIVAKALLELGVKPNDIITVSMPNYYQAIPVFKAANMLGAIVTYLNPLASLEETKRYLNLYESKIFVNCDTMNVSNEELKKDTKVEHIITMKESLRNSRDMNQIYNYQVGNKDDISYHELERIGEFNKDHIKNNFGGKQDALILYTSGSNGKSKSLLYTNENLISACIYLKNSTHVPKVTEDDSRWMNVVPFMYPYGFGASVLQTFLSGREVILTPNLSPNNIAYYYKKNPNLIFGSPAHLELTKRNLPVDQKVPGLKIYLSGGDFLSVQQSHDAIEFFKQHGATTTISNSSGTGETMGCSTNAMNVPYRPETVGQLVLGPDYIVIDPSGIDSITKKVTQVKEVKYGELGVLCTSGKHVFKGYYKNEDLTDEVMFQYNGKKYYATGNIGYLDKDRYFTLLGRASRFFIINTLNKVYCELVQTVVSNVSVVDSCAIVPKPNQKSIYESKAYVVLKDGVLPTKEIENYIISQSYNTYNDATTGECINLKDYEVPASITFLNSLPRTESAEKINYELLKNMAVCELSQLIVSKVEEVAECAIVPIEIKDGEIKDGSKKSYESKAYVVLKDGILPDAETAENIISKTCKLYYENKGEITLQDDKIMVPADITFLDYIPKNVIGTDFDYSLLLSMTNCEQKNNLVKIRNKN